MGRSPCCEKEGLKKGPWTPEEDQKLLAFIDEHGHGSWRALPAKAGLQRCGKSCRLRWTNYLRPDIKRGKFSLQEEQTIIQLHALLGNRWSAIATHLPKRTDNEIKNYWNTHLKKRLTKMGIDPVTHKPKNDTLGLGGGQSKDTANLSHIAQWESARLEAEARLVRESKLGSTLFQHQLTSAQLLNKAAAPPAPTQCLDYVLKAWQGGWSKSTKYSAVSGIVADAGNGSDIDYPTSTLNLSDNAFPIPTVGFGENSPAAAVELYVKGGENDWEGFGKSNQWPEFKEKMENSMALHGMAYATEGTWFADSLKTGFGNVPLSTFMEGFTDLILDNSNDHNSWNSSALNFEENKNYWNSVLNLVNSWPSDSSVF